MALASAAVGVVIGGFSVEGDLNTLGTVLTSVITAGGLGAGGGLFSGFRFNGHLTTKVVPSINILFFCGALLLSTWLSKEAKSHASAIAIEGYFNALKRCSYQEWEMQDLRHKLGLPQIRGICSDFLIGDGPHNSGAPTR